MLEEVQEDFKSLEMALRSRDLKEKGLNNILKDLHHQVSEKNTLLAVLTSENRDLHTAGAGGCGVGGWVGEGEMWWGWGVGWGVGGGVWVGGWVWVRVWVLLVRC
jgi:hypothetical protein